MEDISKEVKIIKKSQMEITEMKYTIKEKENFLEGFSITGEITQDIIDGLEDRSIELTQSEQQREEKIGEKNEQSVKDL